MKDPVGRKGRILGGSKLTAGSCFPRNDLSAIVWDPEGVSLKQGPRQSDQKAGG